MTPQARDSIRFLAMLTLCCFGYLAMTWLYQQHTMLAVDEFWFAHRIYQYQSGLPYRDFAPYKTVIGYYLMLPGFSFASQSIIDTLLSIKTYLALLNTIVLFISSIWLTRFFSKQAVLLSLCLIITSEIFISYSSQIRVDLLGYWFCFFSLLCLLDKKYFFAGIMLGLGFATTQKAIWYFTASNVTLFAYSLLYARNIRAIKSIAIFNLTVIFSIMLYIAFWSYIADFNTVMKSLFSEAQAMYQLDWYNSARLSFWHVITTYNPLLYLLWPFTIISLLATNERDHQYQNRFFVTIYSLVILACLIPYKQVFPYYMQVTYPVLFAAYAGFIGWLISIFQSNVTNKLFIQPTQLWLITGLYLLGLIAIISTLNLPIGYLLLFCIPLAITIKLTHTSNQPALLILIGLTSVVMHLLYPAIQLPHKLTYLEGSYQRATIETLQPLLADGSDYIAGIELIYNKNQPINGIRHLMGPAVDYLYHPTDKLARVMLPSLYEDPSATTTSVIDDLERSKVKVVINNYRMNALPPTIKQYIDDHYAAWRGSLYLYAPIVKPNQLTFHLKFAGVYELASNRDVTINQHRFHPGEYIEFTQGDYQSSAKSSYRLKWQPANTTTDIKKYRIDQWKKVIY